MKIYILLFALIFFSYTGNVFSQSGWFDQTSPTSEHLTSVYFTDANHGYAVGNGGKILRTVDGGVTWLQNDPYISNKHYNKVQFLSTNPSIGFIFGCREDIGRVLKTVDGGVSWSILAEFPGSFSIFYSGYALSEMNIIAVGQDGLIWRTTNGGSSWQTIFVGYNSFKDVTFVNSKIGIIVGVNGKILRTINGGNSWSIISSGTSLTLESVSFPSSTVCYICGEEGIILKSNDAGLTWVYLESGTSNDLNSIFFINNNNGYIVGQNGLIRTTGNGGVDWGIQNSGTTNNLLSIFFRDFPVGYTVGQSGTILKTTDGGGKTIFEQTTIMGNWVNIENMPKTTILYGNYPNPFNPSTTIIYSIPQADFVSLTIYDILGREIKTLVNGYRNAGKYSIMVDASTFASGVYYYTLVVGDHFRDAKKMLLLR